MLSQIGSYFDGPPEPTLCFSQEPENRVLWCGLTAVNRMLFRLELCKLTGICVRTHKPINHCSSARWFVARNSGLLFGHAWCGWISWDSRVWALLSVSIGNTSRGSDQFITASRYAYSAISFAITMIDEEPFDSCPAHKWRVSCASDLGPLAFSKTKRSSGISGCILL